LSALSRPGPAAVSLFRCECPSSNTRSTLLTLSVCGACDEVVEPLQFNASRTVDQGSWDRHVAALGGSVFHTHAWAAFLRRSRGSEPVFVSWVNTSGEVAAIALGSFRSPTQSRLGRAALALSFDAPPATAPGAAAPSVEKLAAWARDEGAIALVLGSFDGANRSWRGELHDCDERIEFLAAPGGEHELWRRMRKGSRSAVRRAERLGVEVERVGEPHVARFVALFASTVERLRTTKRVSLGHVNSRTFADGLEVLLASQRARLYLARVDGEHVGGCFFGVEGRSAYYLFNGSSATALRVGATPLMLLRALSEFSEEGMNTINLGGVPASAREPSSPDHGLYAFKLGLGAEPSLCRGGQLRLRPIRYALLDIARSVRATGFWRSAAMGRDARFGRFVRRPANHHAGSSGRGSPV
jgi:Acetyltransferase (GNAT) domain